MERFEMKKHTNKNKLISSHYIQYNHPLATMSEEMKAATAANATPLQTGLLTTPMDNIQHDTLKQVAQWDDDLDYPSLAKFMEDGKTLAPFWRVGEGEMSEYYDGGVDISTPNKARHFLRGELPTIELRIDCHLREVKAAIEQMDEELHEHDQWRLRVVFFVKHMEHQVSKREHYPWIVELEQMYELLASIKEVGGLMHMLRSKAQKQLEGLQLIKLDTTFYKYAAAKKACEII
mmetsp:Transcript_11136/g.14541  ORF Transcript_11136/g.14541 Transcript_11136/m.14541 type:complete len:234 (+) Transcript_11136:2-703(+)